MQTLLAWILVGCVSLAALPWAAWLLAQSPRYDGGWLTLLVGFALSFGALTLLMFWEAVFGIPFSLWAITAPYAALALIGWVLWRRQPRPPGVSRRARARSWTFWVAVGILALVSAAILFNSAYWPFSRADALGIYGRYGRLMWDTGSLVSFERDDAFYQTYPVLVPLTYTYAYLASGWQNDYLARMIPALLSLGCLPAVYLFGRTLGGRLAGWSSVVLLALTPAFGSWASSGYVDLPMAFFYTLSALFAWRLWQTAHWSDALCAGLMMGLAAWTKNAALLGTGLLSITLLWAWLSRRIRLREIAVAAAGALAIAAPWYIRNVVMTGLLIPPTAWTDQAQPTLNNLLVFISRPEIFGLTGWLIGLGLVGVVIDLMARRGSFEQRLLLLWTLPYFAAWWLLVSYDPRFQLLILPLLTVLAGVQAVRIWRWLPELLRQRLALPVALIAMVAALVVAWNSVEFKSEIVRNPLMGDDAKHTIVLEGR
jgi:4-amino-4-deoxy-L-arabinose transferase-like glycosyltransferase